MENRKRKMIAIVGALALAPLAVTAAALGGAGSHAAAHAWPAIPTAQWRPQAGDVIFRASEDLIGGQIRAASGDEAIYSHVGLVVDHGGRPMVVDVSPFGGGTVKFTDIADFTTDPEISAILVARPRSAFDGALLSRQAERLAAAGVAFDYGFDMLDPRELYCTELVYNLLRDAGADLRGVAWSEMYVPMRGLQPLVTPDALARSAALAPLVTRSAPPER